MIGTVIGKTLWGRNLSHLDSGYARVQILPSIIRLFRVSVCVLILIKHLFPFQGQLKLLTFT